MTRILLCFPGGELTLARYKTSVPLHQSQRKAATLASELFRSWEWASDLPAIEPHDSPCILLIVDGPNGKECYL